MSVYEFVSPQAVRYFEFTLSRKAWIWGAVILTMIATGIYLETSFTITVAFVAPVLFGAILQQRMLGRIGIQKTQEDFGNLRNLEVVLCDLIAKTVTSIENMVVAIEASRQASDSVSESQNKTDKIAELRKNQYEFLGRYMFLLKKKFVANPDFWTKHLSRQKTEVRQFICAYCEAGIAINQEILASNDPKDRIYDEASDELEDLQLLMKAAKSV